MLIRLLTIASCTAYTLYIRRMRWVNEFGELTGYSLVLIHYIGTGKLWHVWQIKQWWINENSLYRQHGQTGIAQFTIYV